MNKTQHSRTNERQANGRHSVIRPGSPSVGNVALCSVKCSQLVRDHLGQLIIHIGDLTADDLRVCRRLRIVVEIGPILPIYLDKVHLFSKAE